LTSIAIKFASKSLHDASLTTGATGDDATVSNQDPATNGGDDKEVAASQTDGAGDMGGEKRAEGEGEGEDDGGKDEVVGGEAGDLEEEKGAEGEAEGEDDGAKEEVVGGEAGDVEKEQGAKGAAKGGDDGSKEEGDDGDADGEEEPASGKRKNGGRRKKGVIEDDEPKRSTRSRTKAETGPRRSGHKAPDLEPAPAMTRKRGLDGDAVTSASKRRRQ
jgi:hypothetical protein